MSDIEIDAAFKQAWMLLDNGQTRMRARDVEAAVDLVAPEIKEMTSESIDRRWLRRELRDLMTDMLLNRGALICAGEKE